MNDFDTFWHEAKAALRVALQWFFLAVPMGLLCGFLGTLFHLAVEHATELRAAQPWLLFLLPVAGLLINVLYKVTKCEGVGTNNVLRAVQSGEPVSILLVPAIFLGTVLTHLCGGSAGREGAALQMGGSIGWNLGTLLRLKDHDRRTATISGMAAFFSALFGTPLAAACFAMMVEDVGLTFTAAFVPAFTSALIAYGCSLVFGIAPTHFALTAPELNVRTALLVILLGVACAAVSRLFCYTLHFMEHTVPKLLPNLWVRVFAGGVLVIGFSYLFGVWQCLAIIPGTSRSGATIVGGLLLGLSRACVAEFTFYLAIPVMAGASLLKVVKFAVSGTAITGTEVAVLLVGCVVAFAVSLAAIRFLMDYVKRHDFKFFGIYRIVLGAIVLAVAAITALA